MLIGPEHLFFYALNPTVLVDLDNTEPATAARDIKPINWLVVPGKLSPVE